MTDEFAQELATGKRPRGDIAAAKLEAIRLGLLLPVAPAETGTIRPNVAEFLGHVGDVIAQAATTKIEEEPTVKESEAQALREENEWLRKRLANIEASEAARSRRIVELEADDPTKAERVNARMLSDAMTYEAIKAKLIEDAPAILRVLYEQPELRVEVERKVIAVNGDTLRGRIARLIAADFFDKAKTSADVQAELGRRGRAPSNIELGNELKALTEMGFFTRENKWITLVAGMKVNVIEGRG
jgi:hypothetical protein